MGCNGHLCHRSLIEKTQKTNADKRATMERDGHTVMLALPSPAGYQRNHAWLLSSGDEHLHTTLDQMKIKLLSIDRNQKLQIKLHFSGEACKHLFAVEESSSKNKPIKWSKPITYQHFWGTPFVATAFRDSQDKETERSSHVWTSSR